jgi:hypothetical protein
MQGKPSARLKAKLEAKAQLARAASITLPHPIPAPPLPAPEEQLAPFLANLRPDVPPKPVRPPPMGACSSRCPVCAVDHREQITIVALASSAAEAWRRFGHDTGIGLQAFQRHAANNRTTTRDIEVVEVERADQPLVADRDPKPENVLPDAPDELADEGDVLDLDPAASVLADQPVTTTTKEDPPPMRASASTSAKARVTPDAAASEARLGAKGTGQTKLFDPWAVTIVGLDGDPLDLPREEKARIDALEPDERLPLLAPYRIAGLKKAFASDPQACAYIDAAIDSRATQPQDPGFVASCSSGVHEPIIVTNIGTNSEPCLIVIEGRQRTRAMRSINAERAAESPPAPPLSLSAIIRNFSSPKKAREVKVSTGVSVNLSALQRAERAQELLDAGIAPVDVAPLVGCTSVKALKHVMEILAAPEEVKDALTAGEVTAQAVREMRHLSATEQGKRVRTIADGGLRGKRARAVARSGQESEETTKAPPTPIVDALAKRCVGSSDPLLAAVGAALVWSMSGKDGGLSRVPGFVELIREEQTKYFGIPLDETDTKRLRALVDSKGGVDKTAPTLGVSPSTLARALVGSRIRSRARAALLKAIASAVKP